MKAVTKIPIQKIRNAKKKEDKTYVPEEEIEEDEDDAETYEIGEEEEEEEENNASTDEGSDSHEEEVSKQTKSLAEEVKKVKKTPIKKPPVVKLVTAKPQVVETTVVKAVDNQKRGKKRKMDKAETSGTEHILVETAEDGEATENEAKKEKREAPIFNDKNVDYNLYNEAPENVATKKIKLSSNIILMCKMIEGAGDSKGLSYDYAALSIIRKTKNNKAYECNLPLTICPNLIKGIEFIMKENKHFFQK